MATFSRCVGGWFERLLEATGEEAREELLMQAAKSNTAANAAMGLVVVKRAGVRMTSMIEELGGSTAGHE